MKCSNLNYAEVIHHMVPDKKMALYHIQEVLDIKYRATQQISELEKELSIINFINGELEEWGITEPFHNFLECKDVDIDEENAIKESIKALNTFYCHEIAETFVTINTFIYKKKSEDKVFDFKCFHGLINGNVPELSFIKTIDDIMYNDDGILRSLIKNVNKKVSENYDCFKLNCFYNGKNQIEIKLKDKIVKYVIE